MLKPDELQLAVAKGLVRQDVTRKEIMTFRQELRQSATRAHWSATQTERDRLRAREQGLLAELETIRQRLRAMDE